MVSFLLLFMFPRLSLFLLFFGVHCSWHEHVVVELLLFHMLVTRCVYFVPLLYNITEETCVCVSKVDKKGNKTEEKKRVIYISSWI